MPGADLKERLESPASKAEAVTPSDAVDLPNFSRAILVGGAGNISAIFINDSTAVTLTGLTAGTVYSFRLKRIRATGTTATSLVALF